MPLPQIVCEKCGVTLAVLHEEEGKPVVRLTSGLTFHTGGAATCPGCGSETKVNLHALEKQIPNVLTVD